MGVLCVAQSGCFISRAIPAPFRTSFTHSPVPETDKAVSIPVYGSESSEAGKNFVYYTFAKQRQEQLDPPVVDDRLVVHAAGAVQQNKPTNGFSVGLCPSLAGANWIP